MKNRWRRAGETGGAQLPLPGFGPEGPADRPLREAASARFRGGHVRVTRDPDVARSYSDNVALGYAVAQGLAQALATLSPRELADLRARVVEEKSLASAAHASVQRRSAGGRG